MKIIKKNMIEPITYQYHPTTTYVTLYNITHEIPTLKDYIDLLTAYDYEGYPLIGELKPNFIYTDNKAGTTTILTPTWKYPSTKKYKTRYQQKSEFIDEQHHKHPYKITTTTKTFHFPRNITYKQQPVMWETMLTIKKEEKRNSLQFLDYELTLYQLKEKYRKTLSRSREQRLKQYWKPTP